MLAGKNIMLTGPAGTGKSFWIKHMLAHWEREGKEVGPLLPPLPLPAWGQVGAARGAGCARPGRCPAHLPRAPALCPLLRPRARWRWPP